MPRRRIALVFVVVMIALGSLLSASAANADPIPPCWDTYDIHHTYVYTEGCAGIPIGESIGYVAVCTEGCFFVEICLYDEDRPPGYEPLCGQV